MRFATKAFQNETVILDGNEFVEWSFSNCKLQYSGGDFNIQRIAFDTMEFTMDGQAARTVLLLRSWSANPVGWQAVLGLLDGGQASAKQP